MMNVMKNPARYMLPGILVNFFDRCPYLMGNRFMHWQGNIAINISFLSLLLLLLSLLLLLLSLLLLLLLSFLLLLLGLQLFQIEVPQPRIIASEDQGTAEVILVVRNSGYMGPFPVYLG